MATPPQLGGPTWQTLEALAEEWRHRRVLRTLRCHPSVAGALQTYAVSDDFRPHSGPSITSVDILTTTEMAPGAWEMLDQHGEALGSGVLGQ